MQRHRQLVGQERPIFPDLPTDDGVARRNVLMSIPTIPPDLFSLLFSIIETLLSNRTSCSFQLFQASRALANNGNATEQNHQRVLASLAGSITQVDAVTTALNVTNQECNGLRNVAQQSYNQVEAEVNRAATFSRDAARYTAMAANLTQQLGQIDTLPVSRIQEIGTQLGTLQGTLTAADVSNLHATLTARLAAQRARLDTYLAQIGNLATTIATLQQQRNMVASTCPT